MIELLLTKNFQNGINLLKGILPLLFITFVITLLFGGPTRTIILILRISIGSLIFSFFVLTTNPADLSKSLEKLYLPHKFSIIPSLSLSLIPRTLKDIEDTYNTLQLRGEIEGSFLRWLPKLMAISISSSIYRSNFIEDSLYIRGFNLKTRKRIGSNHKIKIFDLFYLIFWFFALSIIFFTMQM